jgi:hypothetical protein
MQLEKNNSTTKETKQKKIMKKKKTHLLSFGLWGMGG